MKEETKSVESDKNQIEKQVFTYLYIAAMAVLLALAYVLFIVNNKFAPAGINGVATMIEYRSGFSVGYFSLIVNIPLSIIAFFYVDRDFAIKSFLFTLVYSVSYILLQKVDLSGFAYSADGTDTVLPVLAAGIIGGFVYGRIFRLNASSGGTDIIAKIISKRYPAFNFVWVSFALNIVVAAASYFVYGETVDGQTVYDFKPVILCIIYCFTSSRLGDSILKGSKTAVKFEIITDHSEEISREIIETLKHSATVTRATGMYSHVEKDVLICVVNKHQIYEFQQILARYPDTFAYISTVSATVGNFKIIK